jgi:hypothetical protein
MTDQLTAANKAEIRHALYKLDRALEAKWWGRLAHVSTAAIAWSSVLWALGVCDFRTCVLVDGLIIGGLHAIGLVAMIAHVARLFLQHPELQDVVR